MLQKCHYFLSNMLISCANAEIIILNLIRLFHGSVHREFSAWGWCRKILRIPFCSIVKCLAVRICVCVGMMLHLFFSPHQSIQCLYTANVFENFPSLDVSQNWASSLKLISNIKRLKIYLVENECEYRKK